MMSNFKIETVKWSWPDKVESKHIYRDDQFVRTKTKEEALGAVDFLLNKPEGLTYTITVFRDGEYFTYFRNLMPCLGGLVKYLASHGDRYYMNPYFPRDIKVSFPEGEIIYIGVYRQNTKEVHKSSYCEFLFSQESPWVSAFGNRDTIIFKDNYFVLTNMNTDPTVFYSLMKLGAFSSSGAYLNPRPSWNPKAAILISKTVYADPRRLAGQKPIKISGGTWAEGYGYTRPYNESIYKIALPHKMSQFSKLGSYPDAPHTNDYFVNTMKTVFKVNVNAAENNAKAENNKLHDALVESWTYFKEKASELSDSAA